MVRWAKEAAFECGLAGLTGTDSRAKYGCGISANDHLTIMKAW